MRQLERSDPDAGCREAGVAFVEGDHVCSLRGKNEVDLKKGVNRSFLYCWFWEFYVSRATSPETPDRWYGCFGFEIERWLLVEGK